MDASVIPRPAPVTDPAEDTSEAPARRRRARRRLRRARRARWLRWLLRLVAAALAAIVVLLAGLLVLILTARSVSNAPERVAAMLAAHHAPSDNGVLPGKVATALLATENSRFYHDPAIDPLGVLRAAKGVLTGNGNEGGATIEQQLAKMLYSPGTGYLAELEQVGEAFRLDQTFSKHRILAMYLDAAYFGDGAYGVTAAAEHYFGRAPGQLSWAQASLLAGLVQAPTQYDPHGHLHLARQRQQHVLSRLVATHGLTKAEATAAWKAPLDPAVPFFG